MARILIVDDHKNTTEAILQLTREKQIEGIAAHDAESAFEYFKTRDLDLIITDMKMPGKTGLQLLQQVREIDPDIPVIVITAFGTVSNAVKAMKLGAFDYIAKPFSLEEIEIKIEKALEVRNLFVEWRRLQQENQYLREEAHQDFSEIIGKSESIRSVFRIIEKVSQANSPLLILGESGTGKELVARAVHYSSPRRDKPFIKVNCAALAEGVLESELFGHERGAFTGAHQRKAGRFEVAAEGTIFLDEIGEISPALQVKLLRVLQEREFERVGGSETLQMKARLLAATNQQLEKLIQEKKFREDLYYRLNVVSLQLPPLRERPEDIPLLVNHFIEKYRQESGKAISGIQTAAMKQLLRYSWPGNIRELENAIERAVVLTGQAQLSLDDFPANINNGQGSTFNESSENQKKSLNDRIEAFEKHLIQEALKKVDGNISHAAERLGLNRTTLRYKMEKYDLLGQKFGNNGLNE